MSREHPWGTIPLQRGDERDVAVGPLTLTMRRESEELWLTHHRAGESASAPPADPDWSRWALTEGQAEARVSPAYPDRLVVVNPEHPFTLLRRARARIYVRIPISVRVSVRGAKGESATLTEIPTVVLSDTWWGDFAAGELAYWLPTKARRAMTPDLIEPHFAVTTLQLVNRSQTELPVEKLALRVEHLSLYAHEGGIWGEETLVQYQGEHEGSDIEPLGRPPAEAVPATLLEPARLKTGMFRTRTFARLRALSGLGG